MLVHCGNSSFSLIFSYYHSNIEILRTHNNSFYFEKDKIRYSCFRILQDLLFGADTYNPSPRSTNIKHISDKINKRMEQNRVEKKP